MHLKNLSIEEFTEFQKTHPLSNYHQTYNYALLMSENGYDYDLIGYVDDNNNIVAASLILLKPIGIKCFYGYAPRGFLIDYNNESLINNFTNSLKKYYYEKNVIFIKLNPNIPIARIDNKTFEKDEVNENIPKVLSYNGYKKLKDNLYFEAQLPRFNAIINLKKYNSKDYDKNTKNKIKKGIRKGLTFEKCTKNEMNAFYNIIKKKKDCSPYYYKDYYTVFEKEKSVDLFLVSIDYNAFLENSQFVYNNELEKNIKLNEKLIRNNSNKMINTKMNSDKSLLTYKNDIMEATKGISENNDKIYLAGALVVKHNNTASIIISGYDTNYKRFVPNYFLYYSLIKHYKDEFDYLDLNGVVGDFKNENPYTGLNRFKLSFNPKIYEYIGEYDLIIEPKSYGILLKNGILSKEFNKKDTKTE